MSLSRRLKRQEGIEYLRVGNRVRPIFRDLRPFGAEALLVCVAVLNDQGLHALRMRDGNTETDWCSVIVKVERITRYLESIEQQVGRLRQMIEGVTIGRRRRRVALAKAWKVGRY